MSIYARLDEENGENEENEEIKGNGEIKGDEGEKDWGLAEEIYAKVLNKIIERQIYQVFAVAFREVDKENEKEREEKKVELDERVLATDQEVVNEKETKDFRQINEEVKAENVDQKKETTSREESKTILKKAVKNRSKEYNPFFKNKTNTKDHEEAKNDFLTQATKETSHTETVEETTQNTIKHEPETQLKLKEKLPSPQTTTPPSTIHNTNPSEPSETLKTASNQPENPLSSKSMQKLSKAYSTISNAQKLTQKPTSDLQSKPQIPPSQPDPKLKEKIKKKNQNSAYQL